MYGENTIFEMENPKLDMLKNLVAENSKPKIIEKLTRMQKLCPHYQILVERSHGRAHRPILLHSTIL